MAKEGMTYFFLQFAAHTRVDQRLQDGSILAKFNCFMTIYHVFGVIYSKISYNPKYYLIKIFHHYFFEQSVWELF